MTGSPVVNVMDPTYRKGDWLIFMPVYDYLHDGVYVIEGWGGPMAYRFHSGLGDLALTRDNKHYGPGKTVSREWFREHVLGLAVGNVRLPGSISEAQYRGQP